MDNSKKVSSYYMNKIEDEAYVKSNYEELEALVLEALSKSEKGSELTNKERCLAELKLIQENKTANVFLFLKKMQEFCNEKSCGKSYFNYRGSMCNSYIAYLLGITADINPLDYNLPIEFCDYLKSWEDMSSIIVNVSNATLEYVKEYLRLETTTVEFVENDTLPENGLKLKFYVTAQMDFLEALQTTDYIWHDISLNDEDVAKAYYAAGEAFKFFHMNYFVNHGLAGTVFASNPLEMEIWSDIGLVEDYVNLVGKNLILFVSNIAAITRGDGTWDFTKYKYEATKSTLVQSLVCTREDIFEKLIELGANREKAYRVTRDISFGRGKNVKIQEFLSEIGAPIDFKEWAKKIEYIYPRGQAVSASMPQYYLMAYKLRKPDTFYRYYFENFAKDDIRSIICEGGSVKEVSSFIDRQFGDKCCDNDFLVAQELLLRKQAGLIPEAESWVKIGKNETLALLGAKYSSEDVKNEAIKWMKEMKLGKEVVERFQNNDEVLISKLDGKVERLSVEQSEKVKEFNNYFLTRVVHVAETQAADDSEIITVYIMIPYEKELWEIAYDSLGDGMFFDEVLYTDANEECEAPECIYYVPEETTGGIKMIYVPWVQDINWRDYFNEIST